MVLIVTMIILSVLTAALLPTLFTAQMGQISASGAMRAYYLAEAGGRYVLPRVDNIPTGGHTFKFSGGGTFFRVEKLSWKRFSSTGVVGEGTDLESRVTIAYRLRSTFDFGLFGGEGVSVGNNALVDSYSSSGRPTDGRNGDVGTNGDTITVGINTDIRGEQETSAGKDMEPKEVPDGASSWTNKTPELFMLLPNQTIDLDAGEYYAYLVNISDNSTINITGDVTLYVSSFTFAWNNGTVNINPGGSLTIYAGGSISLWNNFTANPGLPPGSLVIYGVTGCNSIMLGNNSSIRAAICAPTADITVGGNGVVYGSLIGESITAGNNTRIHYDEDLQYADPEGRTVEQYFAGD